MSGIEDQLVAAFKAGLAASSSLQSDGVMTKAEANYGPCQDGSNCCGDCSCYSPGNGGTGSCSIVSGKISENMTCDQFSPKSDTGAKVDTSKTSEPTASSG